MLRAIYVCLAALMVSACVSIPDGVKPVDNFQVERYLGKWYEIARLDHRFERGLSQVSAEYTLNDDGSIAVVNRGYSAEDDEWSEADGKALFVGENDVGYLKVSFFGPFYGAYIVFGLDQENYQHAFVSGPNRSYLWLLARTKTVSQDVIDRFLVASGELGFDTQSLIFVDQEG